MDEELGHVQLQSELRTNQSQSPRYVAMFCPAGRAPQSTCRETWSGWNIHRKGMCFTKDVLQKNLTLSNPSLLLRTEIQPWVLATRGLKAFGLWKS